MTKDEAIVVAGIMNDADGGCSSCAFALQRSLAAAFPEYAVDIFVVHMARWPATTEDRVPAIREAFFAGWQAKP